MGKFVDDLGNVLDDLLGAPARADHSPNVFDVGGAGLSIDGIYPETRDPVTGAAAPNSLSGGDISGVIQHRNPPFSVIDVTPWKLDATTFQSRLSIQKIIEKVGYLGENERRSFGGIALGAGTMTQVSPLYRTVELNIQGTFLKIEFLPTKINDITITKTPFGAGAAPSDGNNSNYNEDQSYTAGLTDASLKNPGASPQTGEGAIGYNSLDASPVIMLQFDTSDAPLLLAKHGDSFEMRAFSKIYLTMKASCPRFAVTAGANALIRENFVDRLVNMRPAYGPGKGLWENPARHCMTFAMGTDDPGGNRSPGATVVNAGATLATRMFWQNPGAAGVTTAFTITTGVAVGWLTGMSLSGAIGGGGSSFTHGEFFIYVNRATSGFRHTVAQIPFYIASPANGYLGFMNIAKDFGTEPRRFILKPGDELWALIRNGGSAAMEIRWAAEGYVYGRMVWDAPDRAGPVAPNYDYAIDTLMTNPFPQDGEDLTHSFGDQ